MSRSQFSEAVDLVITYTRGVTRDAVEKALEELGIESVQDLCDIDPTVDLNALLKKVRANKFRDYLQENIAKKTTVRSCPGPSSSSSAASTPPSEADSFEVPYHKLSTVHGHGQIGEG